MTLPQRLGYFTLGARDMAALRSFYAALGWVERAGSTDDFTTYEMGSTLLALYPLDLLTAEAAPGESAPADGWNGVTFGINVEDTDAVDAAFAAALAAGATSVAAPVRREWGGYSGYFADPEGHRWEVTWAPAG